MGKQGKVVVGMSGGVDSSVAALLLKQQGYDVTGVTLMLRGGRLAKSSGENALKDVEDAERVCRVLDIPHRVLDLSEEFQEKVVNTFVDAYLHGKTPNPCAVCNCTIKFGAMLEDALEKGADFIATGHYAHIDYDDGVGRWILYKGDSSKDQSYVLSGLTQHQLSHTLFPLWGMEKDEVRRLAREHQLPVADKGDSMETCFVPDGGYAAFIEWYTGKRMQPGHFVDRDGNILGRHKGVGYYTIGQRKGLGVAFGKPMYVIGLRADSGNVVLGEEGSQLSCVLEAGDMNYIAIAPPLEPIRVSAKIRYQAAPAPAILYPLGEDGIRLEFDKPQRSITPGQVVAVYDGNRVLGGGIIKG